VCRGVAGEIRAQTASALKGVDAEIREIGVAGDAA